MYQVLGRVYGGEQNFKEKHGPKKKKKTRSERLWS